LKITVTRKSDVAKVKDEFRHVDEPGQIFNAAETVEPWKLTGSVGAAKPQSQKARRKMKFT